MSKRLKVNKGTLNGVKNELKDRGYTLDEISNEIDSEFRNVLYKDASMDRKTVEKLENLLGREINAEEITFVNGKGEVEAPKIEKCPSTAELFGIILGDGYLQSTTREREDRYVSSHRTVITLHKGEKQLRKDVCKLLKKLTDKEPTVHNLKSSNAVQLFLNSKGIIEELEKLGLEKGDKVENQVSVPVWIKESSEYEKRCLKGLIDTDGTIYRQKEDGRVIVQFKNYSDPLLADFQSMSRDISVETSSAGKHAVQVAKQPEVEKFIDRVEPRKASEISF